ncbi:Clavaminate synthase-like protein [Pleurotus eryngii]|uniref:JmjC domain-containing histone demethylation protein 1 n=1 Tax=Pleurotus eryngii TaxID=5323 RepID=A0A9P6D987_PLEER|nr:Clavaminate synthase-like protein [Pleurotus eryngii]
MARNKRKSARTNANANKSLSPSSREHSPACTDDHGPQNASKDDLCPACPTEPSQAIQEMVEKESWVRCDACKAWYHWRCAGNGGEVETIDKWFCGPCLEADPKRTITVKGPARKSSRKRTQRDYANLNAGVGSDPSRWTRLMEGKAIKNARFKHMHGSEVGVEWLEEDEQAMTEPIIIDNPEGLGMQMPASDFTVSDVADIVGEDHPVEVIDVSTQSTSPGWTLRRWADYYEQEPSAREKVLNVISLEVSGTPLADQILPPRIVRELDWVENFWPNTRKGKGHTYPKVQLYCLMGVTNAWTDWHVDFAGSSVYYHIIRGSKVFYFIKPTATNLAAYERWSGSEIQNHAWLGDLVDEVVKVELTAGNTMIIPTGWIHAVHTPMDTLVFGGNFLHSYNVSTQLRVRNIEITTGVPKKFRFPMFAKLCWYVGEKYLRDLKNKEEFPPRVLASIAALADFLVSEARILEKGPEQVKRESKEQVPSDRVKDPPAISRELRWRVRQALGHDSDDEDSRPKESANHSRKRPRSESSDGVASHFRNFKPRGWDKVTSQAYEDQVVQEKVQRPAIDGDDWIETWPDTAKMEEDDCILANKRIRRESMVRVRLKKDGGIERQRIDRILEDWTWQQT